MKIIQTLDKSTLSEEDILKRTSSLPKEVLEHSLSYALSEDKKNSRLAYSLLFERFHEHHIPIKEIHYTEKGKPYRDYPNFFFSISHSFNRIAIRISNLPCGIDIQKIEEKDYSLIASRVLSDKEETRFQSSRDKPSCFASFWAKKEAYLKRTGRGISTLSERKKIDRESPVSELKDSLGCSYILASFPE